MKELLREKWRKIDYRVIVRYILYFACILLLNRSKIGTMTPFAFAFAAALIYLKQNPVVVGVMYVFSGYLMSLNVLSFVYTLPEAGVLAVLAVVFIRLKRSMPPTAFGAAVVLSQAVYLGYYTVPAVPEVIVQRVIEVALTTIFSFAFVNGLRAVLIRGLRFKITVDEIVSISLLFIALFESVLGAKLGGFDFSLMLGVLLVLTACSVFGGGGGAVVGALLGVAGLIYDGSPLSIAVYALLGMAGGIFRGMPKVISSLAVIMVYLLLAYYFELFESFSYLDIVSVAVPCLVYAVLPPSLMSKLKDLLGGVSERMLSRYIVNRSRQDVSNRLYELADVFQEMELMYGRTVTRGYDQTEAVCLMSEDLKTKTCESCGEQSKCWYKNKETTESCFKRLLDSGVGKGRVTLMDLDPYLTGRCMRVASLMAAANQLISVYTQNVLLKNNLDTSKTMIARQMGGVSKIMSNLAADTREGVVFNLALEKGLIDEFAFRNIVCNEVIIYGDSYDTLNVSAVVREQDAYRQDVGEIVSKACGLSMMLVSREESGRRGWSVAYFKPAPKYDVVFGAAGCKKTGSEISGDTHSLIRISEDQFMLCLCDGMGSGAAAEEISSTAISLVENFYRAGFENEVILNSVNKLLAYAGEEAFAAIDIAVLDLKGGGADFIKIGAPESLIKGKTDAEVIEGSSLPLGILEDISPWMAHKTLISGDMVILATDGVREGFGSQAEFKAYVDSRNVLNPQTLADEIVEEAVRRQKGEVSDDMTCLICKLFNR